MKVEQMLLRSEKEYNEDYIWFNENTVMILDGSTNLVVYKDLPDGYWYVEHFSKAFEKCLQNSDNIEIVLKQAIDVVSLEFEEVTGVNSGTVKNTPSAAISIVSIGENTIDCYALGDCSIIVYYNEETKPDLICQNVVEKFDNAVIQQMVKLAK